MKLSANLNKAYTEDTLSAKEAQLRAEFIAWGPAIFQATRIMLKQGIFELLRESPQGLTIEEICSKTGLGEYMVKCLVEASLTIGTLLIEPQTERYRLAKTGWFLLIDPATKVDIDFNHDVNYNAWFNLEESLLKGKPVGLRHFGEWPTVYEGLSSLPEEARRSWFAFDHFYSDHSFGAALEIIFKEYAPKRLFDVGGNTGRWAMRCVEYNNEVEVTILDLPGQIEMMRREIKGKPGAERIKGYPIDLLNQNEEFPKEEQPEIIWMSQFLDCFSKEQIVSILKRARNVMTSKTRLLIMETLWDRQQYEPAALALTMTSLYFTAVANGNSKMYSTKDLCGCIEQAGLEVEKMHDYLGHGHTILVCKIN